MNERRLEWEALRNARDLGGLATADGGSTVFGSVVRSDTPRQLTARGWQALADYGIRTIVDLRFQVEIDANQPLDEGPGGLSHTLRQAPHDDGRPPGLQTIAVSLLGEPDKPLGKRFDELSRAEPDDAGSTRVVYLAILERFRPELGSAVQAIATAPAGGILVHCHAGKDRTGLVVALLLAHGGVAPETIAADYALSGPNIASSLAAWIERAQDEAEREHRRRIGLAPEQAMLDVLTAVEERYGGATSYLSAAGLTENDLDRARARITG